MRLQENTTVKKIDGSSLSNKIYCQEDYAQELYDLMYDVNLNMTPKDLKLGQVIRAEVTNISATDIELDPGTGITVYMSYEKESRHCQAHDISLEPGEIFDVMVIDAKNAVVSAEKAYGLMLKQDLMEAMKENKVAYKVKVTGINDGGFIVNLSGVDCFMPGSLAAANKINDFSSMLGKEIVVMVENYLDKSDMFVVSAKKYIKHIMPSKIKEIDYMAEYSGHVTGVKDYGVFVEWDEIFTGLLHETEANTGWDQLTPGEEITFYIKEVRDNNRIILSQLGPSEEMLQYIKFKEDFENTVVEGEIKDIKAFGIFIKMGEVTGMMTPKEFKKYPKLEEGDFMEVFIKDVDPKSKKIFLRQPDPELSIEDLQSSFN